MAGSSYGAAIERIRAEYVEMPGMRLTAEQVQRLCGVERSVCRAVMEALVEAGFLTMRADGTYARLTDTSFQPPPSTG